MADGIIGTIANDWYHCLIPQNNAPRDRLTQNARARCAGQSLASDVEVFQCAGW